MRKALDEASSWVDLCARHDDIIFIARGKKNARGETKCVRCVVKGESRKRKTVANYEKKSKT